MIFFYRKGITLCRDLLKDKKRRREHLRERWFILANKRWMKPESPSLTMMKRIYKKECSTALKRRFPLKDLPTATWINIDGLLDIYLSTLSNKMNEVMKVLTIIATIFIPITFVAGIYGMNFKFMPELEWRWGYVMVWTIIVVVVGIMIGFFKKKNLLSKIIKNRLK